MQAWTRSRGTTGSLIPVRSPEISLAWYVIDFLADLSQCLSLIWSHFMLRYYLPFGVSRSVPQTLMMQALAKRLWMLYANPLFITTGLYIDQSLIAKYDNFPMYTVLQPVYNIASLFKRISLDRTNVRREKQKCFCSTMFLFYSREFKCAILLKRQKVEQ